MDGLRLTKYALILDRYFRDAEERGHTAADGWVPLELVMAAFQKQPSVVTPTPGQVRATVDVR